VAKKLPKRPGGNRPLPPPPGKGPRKPSAPARPSGKLPRPGGGTKLVKPARRHRRAGPRRPWFKIFFLGLLAVVALLGAAGGYLFYRGQQSLPQTEGVAQLQGLSAPVEVSRDVYGVPHLAGAGVNDLMRAMGFVHAQDRYFQMELLRRMGSGRLAEAFGPEGLAHDRLVRRIGLEQAAVSELNRASPESREILEAYASGVNAYRAAHADRLPPEFQALELEPTPWEAVDSLAIGKWMAYVLSQNADVEMLRANLVDAVGVEAAYRLTGLEPPPMQEAARSSFRVAALDERAGPLFPSFRGASNAWVVGSGHSRSGRPLLASDPHLALTMPSLWYEIHLKGGGLDVAGASLPGLPLVLIGQNERIAWGVTALYADVQDLYIETPEPGNPLQYASGEGWAPLDTVSETIPVKGGAPVTEEVRVSRHGVIVGETSDGRLLSERWDALWSGDHVEALLLLNRAGSWQEFTDALRSWSTPALSFLYGDVEGNIGFFPAGQIPVRLATDGSIPIEGNVPDNEWNGVIPHELKPMIFNPEAGLIVSANHHMLPPETPYPLGIDALADYRAHRIETLLATSPTLSLDDFARFQSDRFDDSIERVLYFTQTLRPTEEGEVRALEILGDWNGQMTPGPAPTIYQAHYRRLLENTFKDELGDELFQSYLDFLEQGYPGGILAIVDDETSPFWDDRTTPEVEDRSRIFAKSFAEAVASLTERFGSDMSHWDWGIVHGVLFEHPLGKEEPLSYLLSRGPIPFGGSTFTIANAKVSLRDPYRTTAGTSFRFLADLADLTKSRSVVPTGASGHPLSHHYFDQNPGWLTGTSHPLLFDEASINAALESKLLLQP
jgi:penicillin amidase